MPEPPRERSKLPRARGKHDKPARPAPTSSRGRAAAPVGGTSYVTQLGAVLRQRDPEALRAFLAASARRYGNEAEAQAIEHIPREELLVTLHRTILARPDLRDLHAASERWLRARGLDPDLTRAD